MVAKFLDDNKPKIHLKENSPYFKLHRSYSISFNLSNLGGISGVESKESYLSLEKERENFCLVFIYSIKRASEIRTFLVTVVQRWLRNVQKSVMHVQSYCFAY